VCALSFVLSGTRIGTDIVGRAQLCPQNGVRTTGTRGPQFRSDVRTFFHRLINHVLTHKVTEASPISEVKEKEYHSRLQGAISSSILSIGDLFKDLRDGSKSVKFPERLLKVLEQKLQDIAMGKDPVYVLVVPIVSWPKSPRFIDGCRLPVTQISSLEGQWQSSMVNSETMHSNDR
jgi:hypothetical protein